MAIGLNNGWVRAGDPRCGELGKTVVERLVETVGTVRLPKSRPEVNGPATPDAVKENRPHRRPTGLLFPSTTRPGRLLTCLGTGFGLDFWLRSMATPSTNLTPRVMAVFISGQCVSL